MNHQFPWIKREITTTIYETLRDQNQYNIFNITGGPGDGKTYIARDLGTRFGSPDGYLSSQHNNFLWLGIFDIYDPDTNSNNGIEERIINALTQLLGEKEIKKIFLEHKSKKQQYDVAYRQGIRGSTLEEARRSVLNTFFDGILKITEIYHLIFVFDTTERLESIFDKIHFPPDKAISSNFELFGITTWILKLIRSLHKGTILFLGRPTQDIQKIISEQVISINQKQNKELIKFQNIKLKPFTDVELENFFAHRKSLYQDKNLDKLLGADFEKRIVKIVGKHPLYLDLIIQMIIAEQNSGDVIAKFDDFKKEKLNHDITISKFLIQKYYDALGKNSTIIQSLLSYLAVARNGLFTDLLKEVEEEKYEEFDSELNKMDDLPFIKLRYINTNNGLRKTYFLHDAMYRGWDETFLTPIEVQNISKKFLSWYEKQLNSIEDNLIGISDWHRYLLVESLLYRMRSDIKKGYEWYIKTADKALRAVQLDLDIHLKDALSLFLFSASQSKYAIENELNSPIDINLVHVHMPNINEIFEINNVSLWIRRYMISGGNEKARALGRANYKHFVELYNNSENVLCLPYGEFLLWYGQSIMYVYDVDEAEIIYQQTLDILRNNYSLSETEIQFTKKSGEQISDFENWYLSMVAGRTYNNYGYMRWMYKGMYSSAIDYLLKAIHYLGIGEKGEERATSEDNLARVYALKGKEFESFSLMRKARGIRDNLGLPYRVALSDLSIALILNRFHRFDGAQKSIESARINFMKAGINKRGMGLVNIAHAIILRKMADEYEIENMSLQEALVKCVKPSILYAQEAVNIFKNEIKEPIRLVEAYNELASCYRTEMDLSKKIGDEDNTYYKFVESEKFYYEAIKEAEVHNYQIEVLDSYQDLAVLYMRNEDYEGTRNILGEIRNAIPEEYKFSEGNDFKLIHEETRIDMYYKIMGLVEMLESAIIEKQVGSERLTEKNWRDMLLNYIFAIAYFNCYSDPSHTRRIAYDRIYSRFASCPLEILKMIMDNDIKKWINDYDLPKFTVDDIVNSLKVIMI